MAPTFLIVGATGNTGKGVVETLPGLLKTSTNFPNTRILALTRSKDSPVAQAFAKLPGVEIEEVAWTEITVDWLRQRGVTRVFIASHNLPNQFAEESTFLLNALHAGVEYLVRISTTAANVRPDCQAYYPRQHWAIETMLSTPEFSAMKWSSLQPNIFSGMVLGPAVEYIKQYRKTGKPEKLPLLFDADARTAIIDAPEVGVFAAHLLVEKDVARHNHAKYVLNGPEDISGKGIVKLIEEETGAKVEDVQFRDRSWIDGYAASTDASQNVMLTIKHAILPYWEGVATASTTSKEVLEIAPPKRTPRECLKAMLEA